MSSFLTRPPPPQTLMTDEGRLLGLQRELRQLELVAQVLLIVYSAVGGPIQGLPSLAERLKRMTCVLLEGMHSPLVHACMHSFTHSFIESLQH